MSKEEKVLNNETMEIQSTEMDAESHVHIGNELIKKYQKQSTKIFLMSWMIKYFESLLHIRKANVVQNNYL